jgi:hypothetical protein
MWQKYYPNGIETVEDLDLIDEPFVSYIINHHGRQLLLRAFKLHPVALGSIALTIVVLPIYLCCCRKRRSTSKSKRE